MTEKNHTGDVAQAAGKLPEWHTPLPWAATTRQGSWDWVIYSTKDPNIEICQLFHDGTEDNETGEANAELIVRAVNALAAQPPAAPVETEAAKTCNSYLQRALDAEADVQRLHAEKMEMYERAIAAEAKLAPHQSCSAESVGCGTLGCTDPNCDYGKGPPRCQSCGAVVIGEPQEASDAYRDTVRKVSAAREKGYAAALENLREAWSAMALIRETVETLGPIGAVPAAEHLDGPTFMHEAEAIVNGIQALALPRPQHSIEEKSND